MTGLLVRAASLAGFFYMLALLFSANYPGPHVAPWQYVGASLEHLVLAMCFAAFVIGEPVAYSLRGVLPRHEPTRAHQSQSQLGGVSTRPR